MREFRERTAVITGAASGIGLALARAFAHEGMNLVLADIDEAALTHCVEVFGAQGHRVLGVHTDVLQRASVRELADSAHAAFGHVHVLCNNAGVSSSGTERSGAVWALPAADWDWVLGVNFQGVLYGLQEFLPRMLAHGEPGHVVNTASAAAFLPGGGTYGASKQMVLALSETLHRDLAARGAAIGASVLCPGTVNTRIYHAERMRPPAYAHGSDAAPADMLALAERGFAASMHPDEVARAVLQAIREARFYVLTHPAWDRLIHQRVETAMQRGAPMVLDVQDMLRRQAAGEVF